MVLSSRHSPELRVRIMALYIKLFVVIAFLACYTNASVQVPKIQLNDGNEMPAIALGTWLGHGSSSKPRASSDEVENAVKWALDAGYRHIDTAWIYKVEDQVGRGLKKSDVKREDIFITTKLWNDRHARDAVVPALRESLKNLQLDYVDLYLIHWPCGQFQNSSYDITDYLETWQGMMEAKKLGLTKSIGLSNFNQEQIQRILDHGLEKPAALQVEINLNLQQPELLAYCKSQNIVVEGYTPFGSLFYSKAAADAPKPRVDDPSLVEIANKYNKTVPQIALRYLVELGVAPLPKSLTKQRLEQNVDIFDFQLNHAEKQELKRFDNGYRVQQGVVPLPKSLTKARIEQNLDIFDFELTDLEEQQIKAFNTGYRTLPVHKWLDHPYYPFEKKEAKEAKEVKEAKKA